LYRRVFGIGGHWPDASGKVRASFHAEGVSLSASARDVEHFSGWFMSFSRNVLALERFDEGLGGYGYKEDIDFSYRVSRRLRLIQTPAARCHHFKSPGSRISPHDLQRMHVQNQLYLHKKLMPQDVRHKTALWWAFVGHFLFFLAKAVKDREPGWVTGLIAGKLTSANDRASVGGRSGGGTGS
jgi:GT2 family glycosyltransferase